MAYEQIEGVHVFSDGEPQANAVAQMSVLVQHGDVASAALMADHHLGYSQPIGGVVAYHDSISPSGVGFDIACGVKAVRIDSPGALDAIELPTLADEIARRVNFGLGGRTGDVSEHDLFDSDAWTTVDFLRGNEKLKQKAREQLGTVGSGNHYVDVLVEDATGDVWVACHFGSRGLGHTIATAFLNFAHGREADARSNDAMDAPPTLIEASSELGEQYLAAMHLAGDYAYAGRDMVIEQVLGILAADAEKTVHNHHNFAWREYDAWVIRKGATPAFPGQSGFVGGSMGDIAAIVTGTAEDNRTMNSTVHGAGRIMGRGQAKGNRRGTRPGLITRQMMSDATKQFGTVVRGGDVDESPHVYRPLAGVLAAHADSISVDHVLRPVVVVMAGADIRDPYKD